MSSRSTTSCVVCILIIFAIMITIAVLLLLSSTSELSSSVSASSTDDDHGENSKLDRDLLTSDRFNMIQPPMMSSHMPFDPMMSGPMMPGMGYGLFGPPIGHMMGGPPAMMGMMPPMMMAGPPGLPPPGVMGGPMMGGMMPPMASLGMPVRPGMFGPPGGFGAINGPKCKINCDHGMCMRQCCSFEPIMRNGQQEGGAI